MTMRSTLRAPLLLVHMLERFDSQTCCFFGRAARAVPVLAVLSTHVTTFCVELSRTHCGVFDTHWLMLLAFALGISLSYLYLYSRSLSLSHAIKEVAFDA